jgi:hypothetical protein
MQNNRLSSFSLGSRVALRAVSFLMVATSATGCVPAKNYEEARSVAESEAQAHERTRQRLEASMERIRTLEDQLNAREQSLAADESVTAESKLATAVATKEKEAAVELVDELRSELARTGDHLMIFAREKHDLAQTLLVAEQRMADIELASKHLNELVATTRDLSLALRDELEGGRVELIARDGQVIVGIQPEVLFDSGADNLAPTSAPLVAALGKVSAQHPSLRVLLRESEAAPASARLLHLGEALRERGVTGSRLVLPSQPAPGEPTPASVAAEAGSSASSASVGDAPSTGDTPSDATRNPASAAPAKNPTPVKYEIAFAP